MSRTETQMRTTRSGRAFAKEFHELFAAFVGGMKLGTHRHLFKAYPKTFTTSEAVATLANLKFAQTVVRSDPKDPSKNVTTTVTTSFSMAANMAQHLCGQFLEADLIFNVLDSKDTGPQGLYGSPRTRQDGIYGLTEKGNVLYEVFIRDSRDAVLAPGKPTGTVASSTGPANQLLSTRSGTVVDLKRDTEDDQLILDHATIQQVFASFAGPCPNYEEKANRETISPPSLSHSASSPGNLNIVTSSSLPSSLHSAYDMDIPKITPLLGVRVRDRQHNFKKLKASFSGQSAINWIIARTTVLNREEAREIASRFLGISYIENVSGDSSPDIKESKQAIYIVTEEGQRIAGWDKNASMNSSMSDASDAVKDMESSFEFGRETSSTNTSRKVSNASTSVRTGPTLKRLSDYFIEAKNRRPTGSIRSQSPSGVTPPTLDLLHLKQEPNDQPLSNAQKLVCILENAPLEALFREFLNSMICSENLEFYHEVIAFKSQFGERPVCCGSTPEPRNPPIETPKMVKGFARIYQTFLAPGAPKDINVNHTARQDIIQYMTSLSDYVSMDTGVPRQPPAPNAVVPRELPKLTAKIFNKLEDHIFHLMASDSVPKFVKTAAFKEAVAAGNYPGLSVGTGTGTGGTTTPTGSQLKTVMDPVKELAAMKI